MGGVALRLLGFRRVRVIDRMAVEGAFISVAEDHYERRWRKEWVAGRPWRPLKKSRAAP